MVRRITVCPNDGNPLISTFAFRGNEWFCMKCKHAFGLLDSTDVDETPELKEKLKRDTKEFNKYRKHLFVGGEFLRTCKLCNSKNEPHANHLTDKEKRMQKIALSKLGISVCKEVAMAEKNFNSMDEFMRYYFPEEYEGQQEDKVEADKRSGRFLARKILDQLLRHRLVEL